MKKWNIIVADDHEIVRFGVRHYLQHEQLCNTLYEATTGTQVLHLLQTHTNINLVLLDMDMPGLDGFETAVDIRENFHSVKIIMHSNYTNPELVKNLFDIGINGYVTKDCMELNTAIQSLIREQFYLCSTLLQHSEFIQNKNSTGRPVTATPIEIALINLLAHGKNTNEIAETLSLKPSSVETYRKRLLQKYHVTNSAHLVHYASDVGILHK